MIGGESKISLVEIHMTTWDTEYCHFQVRKLHLLTIEMYIKKLKGKQALHIFSSLLVAFALAGLSKYQ